MPPLKYRPGAITRKPGSKVDAGVFEVKFRQKLITDESTIPPILAIGNSRGSSSHHKSKSNKPTKQVKTTRVSTTSTSSGRPQTFDFHRKDIMQRLEFNPSSTNIVLRQVKARKAHASVTQASLPPVSGAFRARPAPRSNFPAAYTRGILPILIEHKIGGNQLRWTKEIAQLDYSTFLPLFIEGIREQEDPYCFLAYQGVESLLTHGMKFPEKVHACLHQVVPELRIALNTRQPPIIECVLRSLNRLLDVEGVGVALLPYYRQILPVLNIFKSKRMNLGDSMDYSQNKHADLNAYIQETLEKMERTGGPDAYVNLKYMIPTYEGLHNG